MNQERAVLLFNKFKALKNEYLRDILQGTTIRLVKVKLIKKSESDYDVILIAESDLDKSQFEIDSVYAHNNLKSVD